MSEATQPPMRAEQPGQIGLSPFASIGTPAHEAAPAPTQPPAAGWGLSVLAVLLAVAVIGWLLRELGR